MCKLGVKPDFKVVSARLDGREETGSEAQRVSHPVCVNAAWQEAD